MSQIEISKEGFKLSYQRYLSDGVTGLMFISLFVIAYIKRWELPLVGKEWHTVFEKQVGTEVQIAFLIFLFFIAPSVGLSLSALSWFLLGTPLIRMMWIWHKFSKLQWIGLPLRFFTEVINRSYDEQHLLKFFNVDNSTPILKKKTENQAEENAQASGGSGKTTKSKTNKNVEEKDASENLYDVSNYYDHLLIAYFPVYFASQMEYVQGSKRLFRTIALLLFSLVLYFGFVHYNSNLIFLCLVSAVFFLIFTSLIEYYQAMKMLFMVYSLLLDRIDKSAPLDRKEIAHLLVESRTRLSDTG